MSELKAYRLWPDEVRPGVNLGNDYYIKSEADKVIAELKKANNDKDNWCLNTLKENRHQKYKRCLAMAERCKDKIETQAQYDDHDDWLIINEYWERWRNRWLKIAEQLKEAS